MRDINIVIDSQTHKVQFPDNFLGLNAENLQGNINFTFKNGFVGGIARLELAYDSQEGYIPNLEQVGESYTLPILSSLLTTDEIVMQLVIDQTDLTTYKLTTDTQINHQKTYYTRSGVEGEYVYTIVEHPNVADIDTYYEAQIPIFKTEIFLMTVGESINAVGTIPDEYPSWIEPLNSLVGQVNAKIIEMNQALAEVDNLDITATKEGTTVTITITRKDGSQQVVELEDGKDGVGIKSITKTGTSGLVDTYTITYTDDSTSTFQVTNGRGIVSIEKTDTNVLTDTYTITYNDNTTSTFTVVNGNGVESIEKIGTSGLIDTYRISYTNGEYYDYQVANGNGIDNIQKTSTSGLVDTYTITYTNGTTSTYIITNGNGISNIAKTSTVDNVDTYTIYYTNGTTSTFTVTNSTVTNQEFEELQDRVEYLGKYSNALIKNTDTGTSLTLNDTAKCPMPMSLKPSTTSQATSILPDGYTQVDYIEATNTQYIDTGYSLQNSNLEINTKVYISTLPTSGEQDIVSNQDNSTNRFVLGVNQSYIFGYSRSGSRSDTNVTTANLTAPNTFTIKMKYDYANGTKTLTVNGTTTSQTQAVQIAPSNNTIKLFTNGTGTGNRFVGRIYYLNLIENNILVKEFIPCYRNSDNVVGMYDTVGNTFYTNAGTGSFTYGAVATLPNPDYPQDIHTVSGNNTITICGKNLFPNTNLSNYTITSTGNYTNGADRLCTPYIDVTNMNTLTLSSTVGSFFDFCGIAFYDNNKNFVSRDNGSGVTTFSVSISNNIKYVRAFFQNQAVQYNNIQTLLTQYGIQLEEGNQATTYTPYTSQTLPLNLGTIELCKIGTYEDYFYKKSDKWYLHKKIKKVTLNGSESYTFSSNGNCWFKAFSDILIGSGSAITSPVFSNYFTQVIRNTMADQTNGIATTSNTNVNIKHQDYTSSTQLSDFQTWLSTHNTIVYYVLATPTNTEITDTTLISQLEAIYNWAISYQDQTNITQVNNDLPFVISATTCYDLNKLLTRVETLESEV